MHQIIKRTKHTRPADALPPWTGDDEAMFRWLLVRINELGLTHGRKETNWGRLAQALKHKQPLSREAVVAQALLAARHGDIRPLREACPHLAEFLHLPKLPKGDTFRRRRRTAMTGPWAGLALRDPRGLQNYFKLTAAMQSAKYVRLLWAKHYGKKNRKQGETPATWFAARMWRVSEEALRAAMKEGRPMPPSWQIPTDL
jgi:hypothetical protein